jgi:hypothetical protein
MSLKAGLRDVSPRRRRGKTTLNQRGGATRSSVRGRSFAGAAAGGGYLRRAVTLTVARITVSPGATGGVSLAS